jgi:Tfp pilus assembly protein PilF
MKEPFIFAIFVQFVFLFSLGVTHNLSQSNNMISGHVFNSERLPVAEVYVELLNEVNGTIGRKKTNSGGRYIFTGLSSGVFTVRVLTYGTDLEEQSAEVPISTSGIPGRAPSESIQQDFYLRRKRNTDGSPNVTGVVFAQDVPEESKKLYGKAIDSFVNGNSAAGISFLEEALKAFPNYFLVLERLGQEYGAQEKWESSYDSFKKAVVVNARSFNSWYGLSIAASRLQKPDEPLQAAQQAAAINPTSLDAFLLLGITQRQVKQFDNAEKSLKEADKLAKGKSPDVHWNLALLYAHNLQKYTAAADHLEQYLKVKKDAPIDTINKLIKQFRDKAASSN